MHIALPNLTKFGWRVASFISNKSLCSDENRNVHRNNLINYDFKGIEDWKAKLVLKIFIIIIESVINLLLTVTFKNTKNPIYPETLSEIHKTGLGKKNKR